MRGRRSRDSAGAVSRSKEVEEVKEDEEVEEGRPKGASGVGLSLDLLDFLDDVDVLDFLAESTSAICRSRPATADGDGPVRLAVARCRRTPAPRSATAAKKSMAFRSDGVGTRYDARAPLAGVIAVRRGGSSAFAHERVIARYAMASNPITFS